MRSSRRRICSRQMDPSSRRYPALWEKIKTKVRLSSKGGPSGKWSARKAQLSVQEYKRLTKGKGYRSNRRSRCNSLVKWTREDWGYLPGANPSRRRGRYLPRKVRESLSPTEIRRENRRKGSRRGKWISYSRSVSQKMRRAGIY